MIKKLQKALREEIGESAWENYFAKAGLFFKDGVIFYEGQNVFMQKFVSTTYKEILCKLAKDIYKKDVDFQIFSQEKIVEKMGVKQVKKKDKKTSANLNPALNFDNFIVGDSNSYAHSVCKQVCDLNKFGKLFNPIFIYSATGLGKTHLLHASGKECQMLGKKVVLKTSKTFMNDFSLAQNTNNWQKFYEQFEDCELLLIDDVQFLGPLKNMQDEFFHIFNEVVGRGGQIVMTSDVAPKDLKGVADRLKSRFSNGLIANITAPDLETKQAIIKKKCELYDVIVDKNITNLIANYLGKNIRDIEGMITSISAMQQITGQKITPEVAKKMLAEYINEQNESVEIEDILKAVSDELNIKIADILSSNKSRKMVQARRVAIFLAKELLQNAVGQIAQSFKMKTHSNVSHHLKTINKLLINDDEFFNTCENIKNKLINKN